MIIRPGHLEVFCGPMKSGKTMELLRRVDKLKHMDEKFQFFKPSMDKRDRRIRSRFGIEADCIFVDDAMEIEDLAESRVIVIDEAQFFDIRIIKVIRDLLKKDANIILGGLDLDFRGEAFGPMPYLLAIADEVTKLTAICDFDGCREPATRTQRLINGFPAPYKEKIVSIDGERVEESYEARCRKHHHVPGRL